MVRLPSLLGLQIVLPEGRNISQSLDNRRKMLDDIIHFLFRVINGKAETDRTMGSGERNTHGPEDM